MLDFKVRQPSTDESKSAQNGAAFFANRAVVKVGAVVRITFMEEDKRHPCLRVFGRLSPCLTPTRSRFTKSCNTR
jgi:hypothetical protein